MVILLNCAQHLSQRWEFCFFLSIICITKWHHVPSEGVLSFPGSLTQFPISWPLLQATTPAALRWWREWLKSYWKLQVPGTALLLTSWSTLPSSCEPKYPFLERSEVIRNANLLYTHPCVFEILPLNLSTFHLLVFPQLQYTHLGREIYSK